MDVTLAAAAALANERPAILPAARPRRAVFARRLARWLAPRLALVACATAATLGAVELTVRAVDPYGVSYFPNLRRYDELALRPSEDPSQLFEHVPGASFDAGVPVRISSLGLRHPELVTPKPVGHRRILCLGDSVTFGWGVRQEEAFAARMEARLRALGEHDVEVVNAGVVHYNTVQESRLLERLLPHVDPDLVIVEYTGNDLYVADPAPVAGRRAPPAKPDDLDGLVTDLDWWLLSNQVDLRLMHLLRYQTMTRLAHVDAASGDVEAQRRRAAALADHMASSTPELDPAGCVAALVDMRRRCAERGIELVVAPFEAPEVLVAFCASKGIPVLDDSGVAEDPRYRLSATDAHPDAAGHDRMAEVFVASLRDRGLIPAVTPPRVTASSAVARSR